MLLAENCALDQKLCWFFEYYGNEKSRRRIDADYKAQNGNMCEV